MGLCEGASEGGWEKLRVGKAFKNGKRGECEKCEALGAMGSLRRGADGISVKLLGGWKA